MNEQTRIFSLCIVYINVVVIHARIIKMLDYSFTMTLKTNKNQQHFNEVSGKCVGNNLRLHRVCSLK